MVICVECSAPVSCTYRRFPSSSQEIIRLQRCDACGAIADKYVEYEGLLLFVELLLHKSQTYRHILFNRLPYADAGLPPPLYRLAGACILFDAYTLWFLLHVDQARFLFSSTEDEDAPPEAETAPQQHPQRPQQQQHQLDHPCEQKLQQQHGRRRQHEETIASPPHGIALHNRDIRAVKNVAFSSAGSSVVPGTYSSATSPSSGHCCVRSPSGGASTENLSEVTHVCCATMLEPLTSLPASTSPGALVGEALSLSTSATAASSATLPVDRLCFLSSAATSPPCRGSLPYEKDSNRRPSPDAALSYGCAAGVEGLAAGTAAERRENKSTSLPFSEPKVHRYETEEFSLTRRSRPSSTSASYAEKHADMLRWLLHNPLVSADQQLLILSVSTLDFLVYTFAIIFFTDLFLRFLFKRCHRRQQHRRSSDYVGLYTPQKEAVTPLLLVRASSPSFRKCHTVYREDAAGSKAEIQRRKRQSVKAASFGTEKWTHRSSKGAEETRYRSRQRNSRCSLEEKIQLNTILWQHIDRGTDQRREGQQRLEERGDITSKPLPASLFDKEKRESHLERMARTEGDAQNKVVRLEFAQQRALKTSEGGRENKDQVISRMSTASCCCIDRARTDATYALWLKTFFGIVSSIWKFSLLSASTAAREVKGLIIGCATHEGGLATEDSGVVLVRYNYLAAAVTLSMFGKLGTLILMAWEESLSPRCFTSLFIFTSNVLAVDVFLNGQHHAAAAAIVTAAAAVRAAVRLIQQLLLPSIAFPPCVLPGSETEDVQHCSSFLLNFLSLFV